MSLDPGQSFGSYEIVKLLGRGGMGEVYLAKDLRLNRPVAIKILSSELIENPELLARFHREARLCASLSHPGVCTIHETGRINGYTYICMEYVEGKNLRELIGESPLPLETILDIAIQIADALEEARKKNIIHRDIKSANVIITPRNQVKVLDFGLARRMRTGEIYEGSNVLTESSITQFGTVRGTIAYMAPEQALGKDVDHRTDIFSFGVLLYEMLSGKLPFMGSTVTEVIDGILHKTPVPVTRYNDAVPAELIRVLNKMLEKDPEVRYQSVHEVWADLRHIKAEITAPAVNPSTTVVRPFWKRPALALIPLLLLALIAFFLSDRGAKKSTGSTPPVNKELVSIAVLPFQYQGSDPTRGYLGSLVTDGLIAAVQPIKGLAVAPYANVRDIKSDSSVVDTARDLSVEWIIRGTVSTEKENIVITPEVLSARGNSIWKQSLTGRSVETLDLAAKGIARVIPVSKAMTGQIAEIRTPNVQAYQKYLQARDRQQGWDVESNLDLAVTLYQDALKEDPDFAAAHAGLASAQLNQFRLKNDPALLSSAGEEAQRALGLDPNLPEALLAFGYVQLQSGNSIEAQDAFARSLELAPGDDAACRGLASMYSSLGRNKEAKEMYERAIALRPNFWTNHYWLAIFNYQYGGDLQATRLHLEKAVELHPDGYAPVVMLGNLYLIQGNLEKAEVYFRKGLALSHNASGYNNLGLVHYYRGQYDLALRNWQTLLKNVPDKPMYSVNVADALRQLNRHEEAAKYYLDAIKRFRAALQQNRSDDTIRSGLTMALAAIGQCDEAIKEARTVLSRHPQSPELSPYIAITASRCGDLNWAKEIALELIATDNLLAVRFDPELRTVRALPEVKKALQRSGVS